ncbi:MAG: hypothetical protein BV458_12365 [Thermoplasmata archaeon M9B2D]|nr:MAG: hypothetical protein BV458_12365 [Thermoplasmata archaeon M9B2D]
MLNVFEIPERPLRRRGYQNGRTYRCPMLECDEPEGGIVVDTVVAVYLNSDGDFSDQGDVEWDDSDPARCTNCQAEGVLGDFIFETEDFLVYPRGDLSDLDVPKLKEKKS